MTTQTLTQQMKVGETMYFDPDVVRDILKAMASLYDAKGTLVGLNLESVLKGITPQKMEQYFQLLVDYGFYTGGFDYIGLRDSALRGIPTAAREFLEWSENEEIWNRAKAATEATKGASFKMFLRLLENQIGNESCNIYWNLTQKENGGDYTVTKSEEEETQKAGETMEYKPQVLWSSCYGKIENGTLVKPPYSSNSREELEKDGYKVIQQTVIGPSDNVKYEKIYRDEIDHISENYLILEPTNGVNEFYVKEQDR